jgi:hypothetical protein
MGSQEEYTDIFFKRIDKSITKINEDASSRFNHLDEQIEDIKVKVSSLDQTNKKIFELIGGIYETKMARHDEKMASCDGKLSMIEGKLSRVLAKLDS